MLSLVARCAVLGTLILLAVPASAAVRYSLTDLGTVGGIESRAWAINDNGQVTGYAQDVMGSQRAFLYSNGTMTNLGRPPFAFTSQGLGINNNGTVVGDTDAPSGAFLYSNGAYTDLGSLGGGFSVASGVNDHGTVVGSSITAAGDAHAISYSNGTLTDISNITPYSQSIALAINNAGQIAGAAYPNRTGSGLYHAFLYSDGELTDLSAMFGPNSRSVPQAINSHGDVVGWVDSNAFLYSNGTMTILNSAFEQHAEANDINDAGQIVGSLFSDKSAFLYENGSLIDLNNVTDRPAGWKLVNASGINNSGQIVGFARIGTNENYFDRAFLLTPVPEPSTLILLGVGVLGLLTFAGRSRVRRQSAKCLG